MADTGYISPGTMADDSAVGSRTWSNPDNAKANDGSYASTSSYGGEYTHYLKATNFGFSIPAGATVDGIKVEIEKMAWYFDRDHASDNIVSIVKADGSIGSTNKSVGATWSTTETYYEYGGSSDLWGETWTPTNINDVDFGVVLSAYIVSYSDIDVDHIRIKVYYTVASATIQGISTIQGIQSITL